MFSGGEVRGTNPLDAISFQLNFPRSLQANQNGQWDVSPGSSEFILSPPSLAHFPAISPLRGGLFVSEGGNIVAEDEKKQTEDEKKIRRVVGLLTSIIMVGAGFAIGVKGGKEDSLALGWLGWGIGTAGLVGIVYFGTVD